MKIEKALKVQDRQIKAIENVNQQLQNMIKDTKQTLSNDQYALKMIRKSRIDQKLASQIGKVATKVESDMVKND